MTDDELEHELQTLWKRLTPPPKTDPAYKQVTAEMWWKFQHLENVPPDGMRADAQALRADPGPGPGGSGENTSDRNIEPEGRPFRAPGSQARPRHRMTAPASTASRRRTGTRNAARFRMNAATLS